MRVTLLDDTAEHQIRIYLPGSSTGKIAVSCSCRRRVRKGRPGRPGAQLGIAPLAMRTLWQPGEAMAVWREHMAEVAGRAS